MEAAVLFPTPAHAEAISTVEYLPVMSNCCFLLWVPTARIQTRYLQPWETRCCILKTRGTCQLQSAAVLSSERGPGTVSLSKGSAMANQGEERPFPEISLTPKDRWGTEHLPLLPSPALQQPMGHLPP